MGTAALLANTAITAANDVKSSGNSNLGWQKAGDDINNSLVTASKVMDYTAAFKEGLTKMNDNIKPIHKDELGDFDIAWRNISEMTTESLVDLYYILQNYKSEYPDLTQKIHDAFQTKVFDFIKVNHPCLNDRIAFEDPKAFEIFAKEFAANEVLRFNMALRNVERPVDTISSILPDLVAQRKTISNNAPKPETNFPMPEKATLLLKILPDTYCTLLIDGENKGTIEKGAIKKIALARGEYLIKVIDNANQANIFEQTYSVSATDIGSEKILKVNLSK